MPAKKTTAKKTTKKTVRKRGQKFIAVTQFDLPFDAPVRKKNNSVQHLDLSGHNVHVVNGKETPL